MRNYPDDVYVSSAELLKMLRKPGPVMVCANLTDNDVFYVQAVKGDVIDLVKTTDDEWIVERRKDALYIG